MVKQTRERARIEQSGRNMLTKPLTTFGLGADLFDAVPEVTGKL